MPGRTFVIGDVHGCPKTLEQLLFNVCNIEIGDKLIFIGDLIDRGPDSKSVLDIILNLIDSKYEVILIRGNHEQMMINALDHSNAMKSWFRNGGKSTLDSFDAFHPGFIEDKYIELILGTRFFYETEKFVIVHAGLNFNIANPLTDKDKMISSRIDYCDSSKIGGRKLIIGHTPFDLDKIKLSLGTDLIRLDGGCVYFRSIQGLGYLAALELDSMELFYLQNIDFDFYGL